MMRIFLAKIILATATLLLLLLLVPTCHAQKKPSAIGRKTDGDIYLLLARSIQKRLNNASSLSSSSDHDGSNFELADISWALRTIASTQAALKKIDGTAHEMYQRTHKSSTTLGEEEEEEGENNDEWGGDDGEEEDGEEDMNVDGSSRRGKNKKKSNKKKLLGGLKVAGRMTRNAARVGCIADALFATELCELLLHEHYISEGEANNAPIGEEKCRLLLPHTVYDDEGTLAPWTGRKVVLNTTIYSDDDDDSEDDNGSDDAAATSAKRSRLAMSILVIYEHDYDGGAGQRHGGVDDLLAFTKEELFETAEDDDDESTNQPIPQNNASDETTRPRGRYLIVLSDNFEYTQSQSTPSFPSRCENDLPLIISTLDRRPERLRWKSKQHEELEHSSINRATVCGPLYHMARKVIETILPVLDSEIAHGSSLDENETVQGERACKKNHSHSKKAAIHFVGYSLAGGVAAISACILEGTLPYQLHEASDKKEQKQLALSNTGYGSARTSALCLGPPPCLSSNLQSDFITSVIHGDDIVCRTTHGTTTHLCDRVRRTIKGGILGRSVGWMGEAFTLTVSGLKGDNNDKKEAVLVVPGNVFLVRPRRIGGGSSSIHEIGGRGSRESIRATLLWQLNDVLVSKSLWAHHRLEAYIRSLDKVRLKGFVDEPSSEIELVLN